MISVTDRSERHCVSAYNKPVNRGHAWLCKHSVRIAPPAMATVTLFLLCALVLSAAECNPLSGAITTSCKVDGASRKLTCHFSVDLNVTKYDCTVQKYALDPTDRDPDRVASCNWKPTDELSCFAYGSYELKLNGRVSDTVVIELPQSEPDGRYLCQVITNVQKRQEFCTFIQNDGISVAQPSLDDGKSAILPAAPNTDTGGSMQTTQISSTVGGAVGGSVAVVLVIGSVMAFVIWKVKRRRSSEKKKTEHHPSNEGELQGLTNNPVPS